MSAGESGVSAVAERPSTLSYVVPARQSVGMRLFLAQSLIVAALFIPAGAGFIAFETQQQMASLELRARSVSHLLAYEMGSRLATGRRLEIREVENAAARDQDFTYAVLFDEGGNLLMAHGIPIVEEIGPGWVLAAAGPDAPRWRIHRGEAGDLLRVQRVGDVVQVTSHLEQGGVKAVLVTGFSTATIEAAQSAAVFGIVGLLVLSLLIFFISSYVIVSRSVTLPVMKLLRGTSAIARGRLDYRIDHDANDELGHLATDFNAMAQSLQNSSEAQRTFFSAVTHELRSPLNSMIGFTELVAETEPSLSERGQANMQRITLAGRRLLTLVNDILDLAKLEAAKMTVELAPFSVAPLLHEMCEQARALVGSRSIVVECEVGEVGEMVSDRDRIAQILTNLLSNAVKFTPEGSVTLRARRLDGDEHCFEVEDTGIGIPPELQSSVFESFRQAGHAGDRRGGTGLGLAIVRQLADLLGGRVELASEQGRGSTFRVVLPSRAPSQAALD